ncbi:MAG: hypothetical protein KatS3mg029_0330 [Saprospiraceae bacterium]|nr:MAG: hypothetical protein KatS3mg029_0330 [Saprospiraceae bacterium]
MAASRWQVLFSILPGVNGLKGSMLSALLLPAWSEPFSGQNRSCSSTSQPFEGSLTGFSNASAW